MSQIYKINLLDKNNIQKIFVFKGKYEVVQGDNKVTTNPGNITVFSKSELNNIDKNNIQIQYIDQLIYDDDSILRVKEKILMETRGINLSINQMYLFINSEKKFNIQDTYYKLTQKDTYELNINTLNGFLHNIISNSYKLTNKNIEIPADKQFFTFEDLNKLTFDWNDNHFYQKSLGQNANHKTKYPYITNPFNCITSDSFILNNDIVNTQNSTVLFKFFPIKNNNIYLCTTENVIDYVEENGLNMTFFLKLYFPLLYSVDNIQDKNDFEQKSMTLIDQNKKHVKKYYNTYNNFINLFYELVFFDGASNFDFSEKGINYFEFIIHPNSIIKLPLEILFKTIHSSEKIPLIKYNPGEGYENIYRVFTDDYLSLTGIKVPYMYVKNNFKKYKILELMKTLSKNTSIGFYIIEKYLQNDFEIYCDFLENGNIQIKINCPLLISKDQAETLIKKSINENILEHITSYLKQTGYNYVLFDNFFDDNIEIIDINYTFKVENKKILKLSNYIGCVSSIFNILSKDALKTSDEINLMFKRVSGFKVMDSIKAFITIQRQKGLIGSNLIQSMIDNFPEKISSKEKANEILAEWNDEITTTLETFGNKLIKIENNPGFNTRITNELTSGNNNTVFIIKNINDIDYIKYLNVFVIALFKILMKKIKTKENKDKVKRICKVIKNIEAIENTIDVKKNLRSGLVTFDASSGSDIDDDDILDDDDSELDDDDLIDDDDEDDELSGEDEEDEEDQDEDEEDQDEDEEEEDEDENKKEEVGQDEDKLLNSPVKIPTPESDLESLGDSPEVTDSAPVKIPTPESDLESLGDSPEVTDSAPVKIPTPESDLESLGDSDDDMLDDTSSDEDTDDSMSGGSDSDSDSDSDEEELKQDLTYIKLKGQKGYMTQRLSNRDPELFLKKDKKGYKSFSKSCQSQYNRQPIILNQDELDYINRNDENENIKSYDEVISYENPTNTKKYSYICPRFWCLRDDNGKARSLSLKQVNQGECGGWDSVIPDGAKRVPPGKRILEFSSERYHRQGSKLTPDDPARKLVYKPFYPGFLPKEKHPDGLCIPCCFQNPFTGKAKATDDKTLEYNYFSNNKGPNKMNPTYDSDEDGNIILDSIRGDKIPRQEGTSNANYNSCNETSKTSNTKIKTTIDSTPVLHFPLKSGQLGYMNESLQKFLGFDNASICYTSYTSNNLNKKLKLNSYCLLRLGIEKNKKQSFLCLLAAVFPYYRKRVDESGKMLSSVIHNLKTFKKEFLKNLSVDKFIQAQNGILLQVFKNEDKNITDNIVKKYESESKVIKSLVNMNVKKSIIQSYENFITFFNDQDENIDYTYIWDFVTKPKNEGGLFFEEGINLLIFSNPNDDITNKIELICPTNHYSKDFYDEKRKTLLVYHKDGFFEPIIQVYTKSTTKFAIYRFLSGAFWKDHKMWKEHTDLADTLRKIQKMLQDSCYYKSGIIDKTKYDYKLNKSSTSIITQLIKIGVNVDNIIQILNSNSQVIGLLVNYKNKKIFIPTLYSGILLDKKYLYINDYSSYLSYNDTKDILTEINTSSLNEIPCKPIKKIVDDNMIVGILTETNQLVPIIPEVYQGEQEELEDLPVIINKGTNNILNTDSNLMLSNGKDEERILFIKKIDMENNFYNLFRNTFKVIINYDVNKERKNNLENAVSDITNTYKEKFDYLKKQIHIILRASIKFTEMPELLTLEDYIDLQNCLGLNKGDCKKKQYCFVRKNTHGVCGLLLPKTNLYNGLDNSEFYIEKLADQIIRYHKIRKYLFTPRAFLSFQRVNYKINKDEIVVLEEILLEQYLKDIKLSEKNKYIQTTKIYDLVKSEKITSSKYIDSCIVTNSNIKNIKMGQMVKNLVNITEEDKKDNKGQLAIIEYLNTSSCAFRFIEYIVNNKVEEKVNVSQLKDVLIDFYINANFPNDLIPYERGSDNNNWCFFSIVQWYSFQTIHTENVHNQPMNKKNLLISDIIMRDNYMPTELDLLILLEHYQISCIVKTTNKRFAIAPNLGQVIKMEGNVEATDKYIILVSVGKKNKKTPKKNLTSTISFGLLTYNNNERIPNKMIKKGGKSILLNTFIDAFIDGRLTVQKNTKESKKKSTVKKLGKKKLPSK